MIHGADLPYASFSGLDWELPYCTSVRTAFPPLRPTTNLDFAYSVLGGGRDKLMAVRPTRGPHDWGGR